MASAGTSHAVHSTGVTVIAGRPTATARGRPRSHAGQAILVDFSSDRGTSTWLLWDGKRSQIDLADHAVTNALGPGSSSTCPRRGRSRRGCSTRYPKPRAGGAGHPERRQPGRASRCRRRSARSSFLWPGAELVRRRALLRGVARRPAAHLPGAGRDPAQHQFLWPGTAAAARRRRGGQAAGVADAGHQRAIPTSRSP